MQVISFDEGGISGGKEVVLRGFSVSLCLRCLLLFPIIQHFFIQLLLGESIILGLRIMRVMNSKVWCEARLVSHMTINITIPILLLLTMRKIETCEGDGLDRMDNIGSAAGSHGIKHSIAVDDDDDDDDDGNDHHVYHDDHYDIWSMGGRPGIDFVSLC